MKFQKPLLHPLRDLISKLSVKPDSSRMNSLAVTANSFRPQFFQVASSANHRLHFFILFDTVNLLWMNALGVLSPALNLSFYDFAPQVICAME